MFLTYSGTLSDALFQNLVFFREHLLFLSKKLIDC